MKLELGASTVRILFRLCAPNLLHQKQLRIFVVSFFALKRLFLLWTDPGAHNSSQSTERSNWSELFSSPTSFGQLACLLLGNFWQANSSSKHSVMKVLYLSLNPKRDNPNSQIIQSPVASQSLCYSARLIWNSLIRKNFTWYCLFELTGRHLNSNWFCSRRQDTRNFSFLQRDDTIRTLLCVSARYSARYSPTKINCTKGRGVFPEHPSPAEARHLPGSRTTDFTSCIS